MDTITQGLLGALTGQLGFRQKIGRETSWVAAGAAVLADLDILLAPFVSLSGSESEHYNHVMMHRGLTHSLLFVPAAAAVLAGAWWWFRRNGGQHKSFWLLFGCLFAALLSHPLLDWCTSYGTQLLSPLTSRRYALDVLPIIDFIYTPLLILTLLSCYTVRRATKGSSKATLAAAWIGFGLSLAYVGLAAVNHQRAIRFAAAQWRAQDVQEAAAAGNEAAAVEALTQPAGPAIYHAYPQIGMVFLWRVTYFDGHQWRTARVNLLYGQSVRTFESHRAEAPDNRWVTQASKTSMARQFEWFAMGQVRAAYVLEDGQNVVLLHDMRYGQSPASVDSLWPVRMTFWAGGELTGVERFARGHHDGSARGMAARMWRQIWTP